MSIRQQNEINELRERIEKLERFANRHNDEPRTVAGMPDYDNKPEPKKAKKKA